MRLVFWRLHEVTRAGTRVSPPEVGTAFGKIALGSRGSAESGCTRPFLFSRLCAGEIRQAGPAHVGRGLRFRRTRWAAVPAGNRSRSMKIPVKTVFSPPGRAYENKLGGDSFSARRADIEEHSTFYRGLRVFS